MDSSGTLVTFFVYLIGGFWNLFKQPTKKAYPYCNMVLGLGFGVWGMSPYILIVRSRDDSRGHYNPYSILLVLVQGGIIPSGALVPCLFLRALGFP